MRLLKSALTAVALASFTPAGPVWAQPVQGGVAPVGSVKTVTGQVTIVRGDIRQAVQLGAPVYQHDLLETAEDGSVGITLRDNTRVSLGPVSRLELAKIVYTPEAEQYGLVLRLLTGTLDYLAGLTSKLAPESIAIETPTSTIAVRGTHLLIRAEK